MRRIATALVCCVILGTVVAPIVPAQTPVFLLAWGTEGSADGQFLFPGGVATDATGNAMVVWHLGATSKQGEDGIFALPSIPPAARKVDRSR